MQNTSLKKRIVFVVVTVNIVVLVLFLFLHVQLNEIFKTREAAGLAEDGRHYILNGDFDFVLRILTRKISQQKNFYEISVHDHMNQTRRFLGYSYRREDNDGLNDFLLGSIRQTIYFDKAREAPFISLVFYFRRWENISLTFFIWGHFLVGSIIFAARYYSKQIKLQMKERIDERNRAIAHTTRMIAHDLKAPLAAFERFYNASADELELERHSLRYALNRLHSMAESIKHADIDAIIRSFYTAFSLASVADSMRHLAANQNIELSYAGPAFEALIVDQLKLERAMQNLITNAIESALSRVRVEWWSQSSQLIISVRDDGPGMPQEIEKKLFEGGASHGKKGGTGLGLTFVNHVARGHGGEVRYFRQDEQTFFELWLPFAVPVDSSAGAQDTQISRGAEPRTSLDGRILVVLADCVLLKQLRKEIPRKELAIRHRGELSSEDIACYPVVFTDCLEVFSRLNTENQQAIFIEAGSKLTSVVRNLEFCLKAKATQ